MGVNATSHNTIVQVNGVASADIIPACTGIDSIAIILALAIADDKLKRGWKPAFVMGAVPAALLVNSLRVPLTIFLGYDSYHLVFWLVDVAVVYALWTIFLKAQSGFSVFS